MIAIPGAPDDSGNDSRSSTNSSMSHPSVNTMGSYSLPTQGSMFMAPSSILPPHQQLMPMRNHHHDLNTLMPHNSNITNNLNSTVSKTCNLQEVCDVNGKNKPLVLNSPHRDSAVDFSGSTNTTHTIHHDLNSNIRNNPNDSMHRHSTHSVFEAEESIVGNSMDFLDEWRDLLAAPTWGGLDLDSLEIRNLLANGSTTPTETPEPSPLKTEPCAATYTHNKDYAFQSDEQPSTHTANDHKSNSFKTERKSIMDTTTSAPAEADMDTSIKRDNKLGTKLSTSTNTYLSKNSTNGSVTESDPIARTTQQMGRSRLVSTSSDGSLSRPTSVNSKPLRRNSKRKTSESCEDEELDEETRKEQKLEKNRQSARECRKRKKEYIKGLELMMKKYMAVNDSLQAKVRTLTEENVQLRHQVGALKGTQANLNGVLGSERQC